jgi:hypothetical protein
VVERQQLHRRRHGTGGAPAAISDSCPGTWVATEAEVLRLALALALLSGCPFAAGVPGSRTDVSPVMTRSNGDLHAGVQVVTGAHYASIETRDRPFDVGAGYIYQHLPSAASAAMDEADPDPGLDLHAGFLSFDHNLQRERYWRTWGGARGELWFHPGGEKLPGGSVRLGVEVFARASDSGPVSGDCVAGIGVAHGTSALGLFLDAGARFMPGGEIATTASVGISVRLPTLLVAGFALPCPDSW